MPNTACLAYVYHMSETCLPHAYRMSSAWLMQVRKDVKHKIVHESKLKRSRSTLAKTATQKSKDRYKANVRHLANTCPTHGQHMSDECPTNV